MGALVDLDRQVGKRADPEVRREGPRAVAAVSAGPGGSGARTAADVMTRFPPLATVARTRLGTRADAVPVVDKRSRLYGLTTLWHCAQLAAE
jgi:hypothetical protein